MMSKSESLKVLPHFHSVGTIMFYHSLDRKKRIIREKKKRAEEGGRGGTKSCSDNLFCRLLTRQVTVVTVLKKTRPKMVCHLSLYLKSSFIDIEEMEQLFENTTKDKFLSFE